MKLKTTAFFFAMLISAISASEGTKPMLVQYLMESAEPAPVNGASGIDATPLIPRQAMPLVTGFSKPNNNAYYLLNNSGNDAPLLPNSKEVALDENAYFMFTVTPRDGRALNFADLTLQVGHEGSRTLAIHLAVVVEAGDLRHVEDVLFGSLSYYEAVEANSSASELPAAARVDLSNLPKGITQPVTFRIYAWYELLAGTEIPSSFTNSIRIGKISLTGQAAE